MNDFLLDEHLDLEISKGDWVVGESTYQHQKILFYAEKGEFKEHPTRGVAYRRFLENEKPDEYARDPKAGVFCRRNESERNNNRKRFRAKYRC